jgi:hypothetical protein
VLVICIKTQFLEHFAIDCHFHETCAMKLPWRLLSLCIGRLHIRNRELGCWWGPLPGEQLARMDGWIIWSHFSYTWCWIWSLLKW